jgi:hypothetical protein
MSLQKSLSRLSTNADENVNKFVKNETYVNVLRLSLVCYSLFINKVPNEAIQLFDQFAFRVVVTALVAYLLFKDIISALLLALCFILSIQELKKRNGNPYTSNNFESVGPSPNPVSTSEGADLNNAQPMFLDSEGGQNPEDSPDPAFQTITQNLVEGSFTDDQQFNNVQTNLVQGVDPDVGVKTFVSQHGAQGLDVPLGKDPNASLSSAF